VRKVPKRKSPGQDSWLRRIQGGEVRKGARGISKTGGVGLSRKPGDQAKNLLSNRQIVSNVPFFLCFPKVQKQCILEYIIHYSACNLAPPRSIG
jgi:hypothetical protein